MFTVCVYRSVLESFRLPSCKTKMTSTRFEIGIFDGKGDFGSWKKKMRVLLSHHKVLIALESDDRKWSPNQLARTEEVREEAYNLIFLHLGDSVICKVDGMNSPLDLW